MSDLILSFHCHILNLYIILQGEKIVADYIIYMCVLFMAISIYGVFRKVIKPFYLLWIPCLGVVGYLLFSILN